MRGVREVAQGGLLATRPFQGGFAFLAGSRHGCVGGPQLLAQHEIAERYRKHLQADLGERCGNFRLNLGGNRLPVRQQSVQGPRGGCFPHRDLDRVVQQLLHAFDLGSHLQRVDDAVLGDQAQLEPDVVVGQNLLSGDGREQAAPVERDHLVGRREPPVGARRQLFLESPVVVEQPPLMIGHHKALEPAQECEQCHAGNTDRQGDAGEGQDCSQIHGTGPLGSTARRLVVLRGPFPGARLALRKIKGA